MAEIFLKTSMPTKLKICYPKAISITFSVFMFLGGGGQIMKAEWTKDKKFMRTAARIKKWLLIYNSKEMGQDWLRHVLDFLSNTLENRGVTKTNIGWDYAENVLMDWRQELKSIKI